MSYLEDAKNLKVQLQEHSNQVKDNLMKVSKDLLNLTLDAQGNIDSFEFQKNTNDPLLRIIVKIRGKDKRSVYLGASEDVATYLKEVNTTKDETKKISEINDYLYFLNTFMLNSIPKIMRDSKFSVERLEKDLDVVEKPLLPKFLNDYQLLKEISVKKNESALMSENKNAIPLKLKV